MKLTVEDILQIARLNAWKSRYTHDYIPTEISNLQDWWPHKWVMLAMEDAYNKGLADARKSN